MWLKFEKIHLYGIENFQSNGACPVVLILNDPHLRQVFDIFLILPSDRKSCICHRMAPLQILYIMTLTYIFKDTIFLEMYKNTISGKRCALAKMLKYDCLEVDIGHRMA